MAVPDIFAAEVQLPDVFALLASNAYVPELEALFAPESGFKNGAVTGGVFVASAASVPAAPTVESFSPAVGAVLQSTTPVSFTVLATDLLRTVVGVSFPGFNLYDVAHDGDAFSEAYPPELGNTRVAVTGGFRYTLLRKGGWPFSPRVVPMAFDEYGGVNPISSEVYAWTLVR